ncbi:MAG: hypothetical protein KBT03_01405 [Bacteroidales bacterium]|nr:hypothetical protein [Candidatus Scybalousia scybalohippi]
MKIKQYESPVNFLESEVGLITKTMTGEQSNAVDVDNKKILKGGSIYPSNDSSATGIVFEDVDMTDDESRPISVMVAGRVYENRLSESVASEAKTALEASGIVFVTADTPTFE